MDKVVYNYPMKEKILIAMSDTSLATLISEYLEKNGYTISQVRDGQKALDEMRSQLPDLVLIDLSLSVKNGYEVLTEKSFDKIITKIPVIIVSNTGSPIEMRRIPSTKSVKDYIIKTHIEPEDVLRKIDEIFEHPIDLKDQEKDIPRNTESSKKILWVEDDKFLSSILVRKFESSGYIVLKAKNSDEALEIIQNGTPDIIILDILLPGLSGFDILQKIKIQDKFKKIPVIILSNMSRPSDLEKAKILGTQRFLVKASVSLDQIIKEVATLTKRNR